MEQFDISKAPFEIERKFLIGYPDLDTVAAMPDYRVLHIEQTYLKAEGDLLGGRVRRITEGDRVSYVYTYKVRVSDVSRREYERELSADEYRELLSHRLPDATTVIKDRHRFSYAGLTYELDVYDFWDDRATLEAEVKSESTPIPIPPCVTLIREVTFDHRYNNSQLALNRGVIE